VQRMTSDPRLYERDTEVAWQARREARRAAARARREKRRERILVTGVGVTVLLASAYLIGHLLVALLR